MQTCLGFRKIGSDLGKDCCATVIHYNCSLLLCFFHQITNVVPQIPDMKMHHTEYNTTLQRTAREDFFPWHPPTFRSWTQNILLACRAVCDMVTSASGFSIQNLSVNVHGASRALNLADSFCEELGPRPRSVTLGTCSPWWMG